MLCNMIIEIHTFTFQIRPDGAEEGDPAAKGDGQERETGRGGGRAGPAGPDRG